MHIIYIGIYNIIHLISPVEIQTSFFFKYQLNGFTVKYEADYSFENGDVHQYYNQY